MIDRLLPALVLLLSAAAALAEPASSVEQVQRSLARIAAYDRQGPALHAVLAVAPDALAQAAALDRLRQAGRGGGPLHGVPVLLKDNIDTADLPTTAGSLALAGAAPDDAFLVGRLRAAGMLVLGKTNLSEWSNMRSVHASSGWSARGGQTRNPHAPGRSPCGSSAGSAVAVAAGYVDHAIGTETDGSIVCPASATGVVGLKPTLGRISRDGIVPIAASYDTAGTLTRNVAQAAALLQVLAAADPADPASAPGPAPEALAALDPQALRGARIGVARRHAGFHPPTDAVFEQALGLLRAAGAEILDPADPPVIDGLAHDQLLVLLHEFRLGIEAYLPTRSGAPPTLSALIDFNRRHAARELPHFGQDLFERAAALRTPGDVGYRAARSRAQRMAAAALDRVLRERRLDALVAPTVGPAWWIDPVLGDHYVGGGISTLPAIAGYPHLSVPMGRVAGLPVGLSFVGPAWSEARLLALGHAYELRRGPLPAPAAVQGALR